MRQPVNRVVRPPALAPGSSIRVFSPASASDPVAFRRGVTELERLGYHVQSDSSPLPPEGYFAAPLEARLADLASALRDPEVNALIAERGGYGSAALLDHLESPGITAPALRRRSLLRRSPKSVAKLVPKLLIGYSDITALQTYLWQRWRWATIYGPMVAAGFGGGADQPGGYDLASFLNAVGAGPRDQGRVARSGAHGSRQNWTVLLGGETLVPGSASGVLLGGCLALLQTTLGTPWEIDTTGAILLLEDCGVKPYQVDRMLVHLAQAGKFRAVRGIVLGEFPGCEPPPGSNVTVRDVCQRLLSGLRVPITFGAAVGHTPRPMLTLPLGVRATLTAVGEGKLDVLEPAVSSQK